MDLRKPHPLESALCGSRWAGKTPAVSDSFKRCTPWLELETYCANLKSFAITLCPLRISSMDIFFFWIWGNPTSWKAHFVGPGERVKPRLSQALTRGARPDSNSRPAVQISNLLPSRYASWGQVVWTCTSLKPKYFLSQKIY